MSSRDRRSFLRTSALLAGGITLAGCSPDPRPLGPEEAPSTPAATPPRPAAQAPGESLGRLADLPDGAALEASHRGLPVLVIHQEGKLVALSALCTHETCRVEWRSSLGILQCPCHDGRFDLQGKVLSGPPPAPLLRFEVEVRDGQIYLREPLRGGAS